MFVTNQWYVIAYARDIGPEPFSRTVCGERILVYRKQDGSVTAMRDACPHRLLPLSMGIKEGDNIRCRYHGLVLDADGRAVEMPIKSDPVNRSICAAKYPVVERYQFIWVWIGEPAKADPALLPDYWMCEDPGWVFDGGSYHVRCNYQLLVDNLMDLTHETYVHEGSIGQPELMQSPITSRVEGDRVIVERWMHDVPPAPAYRTSPDQENVDRWQICHFLPPSSVIIDVGVAPVSEGWSLENHPVRSFVIDAITPETETTSWYYWGAARGVDIGNAERTARTKMLQGKVFAEDIAVLEAQQQSIEDNPDLKLRAFNIDAGGVRSRTIIRKMAQRDGAAAAMDASDAEQELA